MAFSLIANGYIEDVTQITPEMLKEKGITLVLADLDNTLATYKMPTPDEKVIAWRKQLRKAGIDLFVLSNSRKPHRVEQYAAALDAPFRAWSNKPSRKNFVYAMQQMGKTKEETLMLGDQIFTDVLGANRAGVAVLLVKPIALAGNIGRYIRFFIETPFRKCAMRRKFL